MYQSDPILAREFTELHRDGLLATAQRVRPLSTGHGRRVISWRMPSFRRQVGNVLVRVGERLAGAPAT